MIVTLTVDVSWSTPFDAVHRYSPLSLTAESSITSRLPPSDTLTRPSSETGSWSRYHVTRRSDERRESVVASQRRVTSSVDDATTTLGGAGTILVRSGTRQLVRECDNIFRQNFSLNSIAYIYLLLKFLFCLFFWFFRVYMLPVMVNKDVY